MFEDEQQDQNGQTQYQGSGSTGGAQQPGIGANPAYAGPPAAPSGSPSDSTVSLDSSTAVADTAGAPAAGAADNPDLKNLEEIKGQALAQLSPLVHKLDQTPEEKYKTLMMVIQASDSQDLISEAYKAAQEITDEKAKAEALMSIINEINYFTQKPQ